MKTLFRYALLCLALGTFSASLRAQWVTAPPGTSTPGATVTVTASGTVVPNGGQVKLLVLFYQTPNGTWYNQVLGSSAGGTITQSYSLVMTAPTGSSAGTWNWSVTVLTPPPPGAGAAPSGSVTATSSTFVSIPVTGATIAPLTYNGSPQSPSPALTTTVPAGASVNVSAPAQTNAGTFTTATVSGISPYSGTLNNVSWTINPAAQSITFNNPGNPTFGTTLTLSASATSGLPISFSGSGVANVTGNTVTFTGVGSATITATQTGNGNFSAAPAIPQNITVNPIPTTFSLSSPTFIYNGAAQGPLIVSSPSGASFTPGGTLSATVVAPYTATASAFGNYSGSNPGLTWNIIQKPQSITFGPISPQTYGTPVNLGATSDSGLPITYTVTSGPATVSGNTLTLNGVGTVTVSASQPGNANIAAAPSIPQSFLVNPAPATFSLSSTSFTFTGGVQGPTVISNPAAALPGATTSGTLTATPVNSYSITATAHGNYTGSNTLNWTIAAGSQTIPFNNPGTQTYGAVLSLPTNASSGLPITYTFTAGSGTVSGGTVNLGSAGSVTLTANQPGNSNYGAAPTVVQPFTVNKAVPVGTLASRTLVIPPASGAYIVTGSDLNALFKHATNSTVTQPTGTVSYAIATGSPNGTVGSSVTAGLSLSIGTYLVQANYAGDTNYSTANTTATWLVVLPTTLTNQLHLVNPGSPPQNDVNNVTGLTVHKP